MTLEAGIAGVNQNPLAYTGTPTNFAPAVWFDRDPTTADVNFPFMTIAGNSVTGTMFIRTNSAAVWLEVNSGSGVQPVPHGGTGLSSLTAHTVVLGEGTNAVGFAGPAAAGTVLQGAGASADPAFSTATYPATTAQGDLLLSASANAITALAKNASATRYLANTGSSNNAAWDQVNVANGVTGTLPVGNGGIGAATLAAHGVLVGEGTSAVVVVGPGATGTLLQGAGVGADPAFTTATYPATSSQGDILVSSAANTITTLAKDTNATRYLANTGASNEPAWNQVNLTNGVTGTLPISSGGTGLGGSQGTVQTTDATPTTALSIALGATPSNYTILALVSAYASVGVGAPLGAGFFIQGAVRTSGAAATLVGTLPVPYGEGALAAATAVLDVTANTAIITVTGVAAYTISWKVDVISVVQGA